MAALIRAAALALAGLSPAAASAQTAPRRDALQPSQPTFRASSAVERWQPYIAEAAQRFGIPQEWIAAVMEAESGGQTHRNGRPITSQAGAMGLMQIMPGTYAAMRARHDLDPDPYDPHDNIVAGAAYLRLMFDRFGYPGLFAAYNAGPGRYAEHLATGKPLAKETRDYIAQLARTRATPSMPPAILSGTRLFFRLDGADSTFRGAASASSERGFDNAKSASRHRRFDRLFVPLTISPDGK